MALTIPSSSGDLLQELAMSELREVYSKINTENFLLFQTFEQSYQQYLNSLEQAINDDAGVDFLNCFMATSESFQQHLSSLCQQISAIAERVAITPDGELSEAIKESLLVHLERQYTMFQNLLQLWSLLEVFELSAASSSKHLAFDLIPWLTSSQYSMAGCYEAFKAMTHPEHFEGDGQGQGFWQVVYDNALQGHISAVTDLLKLHSEFSVHFLSTSSNDIGRGKGARRAVTKEHVNDLLHLLESYPYRQLLDTLMPQHTLNTSSIPPFQNFKEREEYLTHFLSIQHPHLVSEFQQWQESLQHYRDTSLLLTQIPELDFLVRLLQGERRAIEVQSKGQWHAHLLALVLYQFPCHQLTKINLKQMMEEVLNHYHHVSSVDPATTSLSLAAPSIAELSLLYREVLRGNIGFILKIVYEASYITLYDLSSSISPVSSLALVGKECGVTVLLQLTHVSRLLTLGANLLELTTPLPHSMHHLSFFEEVVLETGERLAQLHYPYDMLRGYLSLSPQFGSLFYRELLLRQPINSDDDCERVAEALRQAHFIEDSQRIYALRGKYWLHSPGNLSRLREDVASNVKSLGWHGVTSSTMSKAAHYYTLAKENDVVALIIETSLYRCMHAVVQCSDIYFQGMLHYQPGKPVLPLRPGQPLQRAPPSSSASASQSKNEVEGEEELRRYVEYLDYALHEAEGIVQILAPLLTDNTSFLHRQYTSLLLYSQAVTTLLLPKSDPPNHSYRQAADNLCRLLVPIPESVQPPHLSCRYWLHLLELSYFVHHLISSLELQQSLDHSFLHQLHSSSAGSGKKSKDEQPSISALAVLDDTMIVEDAPTSASALTHYGQPVFSKAVIGQFHVILTLLEQQSDFLYLLHLCRPHGSSEETEIRSQLKMNLISLLTSAFLVSSHFHFTSSHSSSTHLTATTFLDSVKEKNKRDMEKASQSKLEKEGDESEEGGADEWRHNDINASYDLADILDGSAFL